MKNTLAYFGLTLLVALLLPAGSSAQSAGDEVAAKITSKKKSKKKAKAKVEQSSTEDDTSRQEIQCRLEREAGQTLLSLRIQTTSGDPHG